MSEYKSMLNAAREIGVDRGTVNYWTKRGYINTYTIDDKTQVLMDEVYKICDIKKSRNNEMK